jgi:hypothetical protein
MMGMALKSALVMVGSSASVGSRLRTVPTWRSTSIAAWLPSTPSTKAMVTMPSPSVEREVNWSIPAIPATASSIGLTTKSSTSSGEAPGKTVTTVTNGKSTLGKLSSGIKVKAR